MGHMPQNSHEAGIFLLGEGVEATTLTGKRFDVSGQVKEYAEAEGVVLSCKSCIEHRKMGGAARSCAISTMKDLMVLIEQSEKVVSFG